MYPGLIETAISLAEFVIAIVFISVLWKKGTLSTKEKLIYFVLFCLVFAGAKWQAYHVGYARAVRDLQGLNFMPDMRDVETVTQEQE